MENAVSSSVLLGLFTNALVSVLRCSERFHARLHPGVTMVLSGEPFADLNCVVVNEGPRIEEWFSESVRMCTQAGIPFLVILGPSVADALTSAATELGLRYAAEFPLMVCEAAEVKPVRSEGLEVVRATSLGDLRNSAVTLSRAFNLSEESVLRACPLKMIENPVVDVFVALLNGQPVGSVTTTIHHNMVGIWAMGTDPAHQRQGFGRTLLAEAMHDHVRRGARQFFLGATSAGKPLYEQLAFVTQDVAHVWVAGHTLRA